jgi:hypothetical protein
MASTPNYNWPTPDNTDLVKNGALAIRTLGDAIDTTVDTMIPETIVDAKGDLIAATAADTVTRLAVGANGTVLKANSATATGLEWATDASGMTNPMTTTADVIYSSSGSTPARLGIGTAGQVLTVNSGATAPEWATPAAGGSTFVGASVHRTANQSLSNNVYTTINFTAENFDTDGFHDNSVNNTRLTIPSGKGGYYHITSQIAVVGNTAQELTMRVLKNNANLRYNVNTGQTYDSSYALDFITNLSAADYIELSVYQNSGTAKDYVGGAIYGWFELTYLGA